MHIISHPEYLFNVASAILAMGRLASLESKVSLTQHEVELAKNQVIAANQHLVEATTQLTEVTEQSEIEDLTPCSTICTR